MDQRIQKLKDLEVLNALDLYFAERLITLCPSFRVQHTALLAALMKSAREGHLCFQLNGSLEWLLPESERQILEELVQEAWVDFPNDVKSRQFVHIEGNFLYLKKHWQIETSILERLKALAIEPVTEIASDQNPPFCASDSHGLQIAYPHPDQNPPLLNKEQSAALKEGCGAKVFFLAGGPGTGKTFMAASLVREFLKGQNAGKEQILLAAPTSRAAEHLKKVIGAQLGMDIAGGTLHHLVGWKSRQECYLCAQYVIVDESSMLDVKLFELLLQAVSPSCRLIFMGDPEQIPPVGTGNLFADLVQAKIPWPGVGYAQLEQSRRTENTSILELARAIQQNSSCAWPLSSCVLGESENFYDRLWELTRTCFPIPSVQEPTEEEMDTMLRRFQILSVLRQGPFGVDLLNQALGKRIAQGGQKGEFFVAPIVIERNDRATELSNGEMGIMVTSLDNFSKHLARKEGYVYFPGRKEKLPIGVLPSFSYAYCCSVHASQGSEYDEILLIVPPGSEKFGREMLYTAITRAKHRLQIVGQIETLEQMKGKIAYKLSGVRACIRT